MFPVSLSLSLYLKPAENTASSVLRQKAYFTGAVTGKALSKRNRAASISVATLVHTTLPVRHLAKPWLCECSGCVITASEDDECGKVVYAKKADRAATTHSQIFT